MKKGTKNPHTSVQYYLFLSSAILYIVTLAIINILDWQAVLSYLSVYNITLTNSPLLALIYQIRVTNDIIYSNLFLKIVYTLLSMLVVWAGIILLKGRTLIESIGLVWFYAIPRPNYFWGEVIDQSTGKPLAFCRIKVDSIHLQTGKVSFVTESITDLFGRYRINFATNYEYTYLMQVIHPGYKLYEKKIRWDLDNNATIYNDIKLIPEDTHYGFVKNTIFKIRNQISAHIVKYVYFISLISFSIIAVGFIRQLTLGTLFYFLTVSAVIIWNSYIYLIHNKQHYGRFIFEEDGLPGSNLTVNIYKDKKQIGSATSNSIGEISFNVQPGEYEISFLSQGVSAAQVPMQNESFIPVTITQKGFLANDLFVKKTGSTGIDHQALANPFA